LKVAPPFPVRHRGVEFSLLGAEEVQVVLDDVFAERLARPLALREGVNRFVEGVRNVRQIARSVHVAFECWRRFDAMLDAIEACGDRRSECKIWIRIRPRRPAFDAQRLAMTDDAESRGAVVDAPCN